MLYRHINKALMIFMLSVPAYVNATPIDAVTYDEGLSLRKLTERVYAQLPEKSAEMKFQQLSSAHDEVANAVFAEPMVGSITHYNDAIGSGDGLQEWEGSVELPLWLPGQKASQKRVSTKLAEQLPAYQQQTMLMAAKQVRELLWDIKLAESKVFQDKYVLETAQKLEKDVNARVEAGDLPRTELLLVRSNVIEAKANLLTAEALLSNKVKLYAYNTGTSRLPAHYEEELFDQDEISQQHPLIQMQDQVIALLQARQDLAKYDGSLNPNLSIGMRRERGDNNEPYNNSLGLGLSIALNDSRYRQPAIAEAGAELAEAQVERQHLFKVLNEQLITATENLHSKQLQMDLLLEQNSTTQSYFAMQQVAFELGEISLIDLLRSQLFANESQSKLSLLEVQIKKNIADINQVLGIIP